MPRATASIEAPLRVPPHSAEAERGVLGSILLDAARVMDLCIEAGLEEDSFHLHAHRVVFSVFLSMSTGNQPIDMLTAIQQLRAIDRLKEVGGAEFLEKLVDATPTAAHAEYYIDLVRQKHLLRRTIACARRVEQNCYEEGQSADEILSGSEQHFLDLTEHQKRGGQAWPEAIKATFARIERIMEGGVSGISTGFLNLDHKLRGLRNGEMLVLAARPSMGKTSLAMNICECLALGRDMNRQPLKGGFEACGGKCPVAIFSLEMSQEALAMRMLCAHAGISGYQLEGGYLNPQQVNRHFMKAASELNQALLYVDDTGGLDVMELRARARRMKKQFGIGLIMVDYLQLLNCREYARQGRQLETSAISAQLKSMAKELNLPVLVLSQLSRAPEQRVGDKTGTPRLSDLRDSGAIEQDADVVLLLRRPCKYKGDKEYDDKTLAIVDVAKHRNGPTGEVRLNFDEHFTRFSDRAETAGGEGDMAVPDDGAEAAGLEP
jgi:replicative DNA helicase